jgi:hypothetical protein
MPLRPGGPRQYPVSPGMLSRRSPRLTTCRAMPVPDLPGRSVNLGRASQLLTVRTFVLVPWRESAGRVRQVDELPGHGVTARIRRLPESAISRFPAGPVAIPSVPQNLALVAGPPSPENPHRPSPAIV